MFIVLDGPDGCGKSTQAELLCTALRQRGSTVRHRRDPGGTPLGEAIRRLLLEERDPGGSSPPGPHPRTELLLFFASRMQLAHEEIRPALRAGEIVVCERWISSTYAYQACASGEDAELVLDLARRLMPDVFPPTLTILLDLDVRLALDRACGGKDGGDRIEGRGARYHEQVRRGFLRYARIFPDQTRIVAVGARTPREVHAEILEVIGPPPSA